MPELPPLPPIVGEPISVVLLNADAAAVVADWTRALDGLKRDYEILVVGYDAPDVSAERVRVLKLDAPGGVGDALKAALAVASKPLLVTATGDRQYDPADLSLLLAEIDKVHLISGFRRGRTMPLPLRLLGGLWRLVLRVVFGFAPEPLPSWLGFRETVYRWLIRVVFAVRLRDVNCALRLYRREIFDRLPIQSHGDFVHAEVLAKANFLGCYMNDDILVTWRPRTDRPSSPWRKDFLRLLSHPSFRQPAPPSAPTEPAPAPA